MRRFILVFAAVAPMICIALAARGSWIESIALLACSHALIIYPTLRPTSQWLGPVITRFRTQAKEVWLTIDDGPDPVDTPVILSLLRKHRAKATFFVKGTRVREFPAQARAIVDAGHELANHSDTHPSGSFWALAPSRIAVEVDGCNEAIAEITGAAPRRFRAPVGHKNPFVHPVLAARGMSLIAWSARGFDGVAPQPRQVIARILRGITPGAIVLLHEGRAAADGTRVNVVILEELLEELAARGYRCVVPEDSRLRT